MPPLNEPLFRSTATQRYASLVTGQVSVLGVKPLVAVRAPAAAAAAPNEAATYLAGIIRAICQAHEMWRLQASLTGVTVNAVTAHGGVATGPNIGDLIGGAGPRTGAFGGASAITTAVAQGLGKWWAGFQASIKVPGLPWYPAFAAFPGAIAPPMPNVPTPLIALAPPITPQTQGQIKEQMTAQLHTTSPNASELVDAIATGFAAALQVWLPAQMVSNVLATGPIPSWAPPYVPVGPVVGGTTLPTSGHFAG